MIRLQDPMAFEAYVCLSPAEYISARASGTATEIGLDSSRMQISERRHQEWFPNRRETSTQRTSVACVAHAKHASIRGHNYIKRHHERSKVHCFSELFPALYIHCDDVSEMWMIQSLIMMTKLTLSKFDFNVHIHQWEVKNSNYSSIVFGRNFEVTASYLSFCESQLFISL